MVEKKFEILEPTDYQYEIHKLTAWGADVSDGYHTMEELYEHRYVLFMALCKIYDDYITPFNARVKCWKSKLHSYGTMFDNSFILGMTISHFRGDKQISYHLPLRYWDKTRVVILPKAPEWDGHTSKDVLERLLEL